jgi:hypothetical protein
MKMGKNNGKGMSDGRYLAHCAEQQGLRTSNGKGDHKIIYSPVGRGYMSVPQRELGKGLACAIRKWLIAAGISFTLFLVWWFMPLFGG